MLGGVLFFIFLFIFTPILGSNDPLWLAKLFCSIGLVKNHPTRHGLILPQLSCEGCWIFMSDPYLFEELPRTINPPTSTTKFLTEFFGNLAWPGWVFWPRYWQEHVWQTQTPTKTKISNMMGLGKGGLRLKIWSFLISMLDFWGVNCKLMGNSDCFEDLFLDCTPWNWQKTNKKTQSWMPSLIVGLSTPCGPVHFLDDREFGSLIFDLSNPTAKSSC